MTQTYFDFGKYEKDIEFLEMTLYEMEELKNKYLETKNNNSIKLYIRKLQNISTFTDVSKYLLDDFGKIVIEKMIELNIHPTIQVVRVICNHQELFEKYLLLDGTTILLRAPDSVYNLTIKGKPLIEYLFENNLDSEILINSLIGCPNIFEYMKKYNKEHLVSTINPVDFLTQRGNGKLLLDELIESKIDMDLRPIYLDNLINEILKRKAYYLLMYIPQHIATRKQDDGETFFEFLLNKGIVCNAAKESIMYGYENSDLYIDIIIKNNRLDLLVDVNESLLNKKVKDNKTILELLLDNNLTPTIPQYKKQETVDTFLKYERYEELQKCTEDLLIVEDSDKKRLIDKLFERNLGIDLYNVKSKELLSSINSYKRTDLYPKIQLSSLLYIGIKNQTLLEYIIDQMKSDDTIKIKDINYDLSELEEKAEVCITLAKNQLIHKITINKSTLLYSDGSKTLLEYLLDMDFDTTNNNILTDELKNDKEIGLILELYKLKNEIEKSNMTIKLIGENHLNNKLNEWNQEKIELDESLLLDRLKAVYNDGESDTKVIDCIISLYRHLFATKNIYANEVIHLIDIKLNNPQFTIKKTNKDVFNQTREQVEISELNFDVINHEFGHMFMYFLIEEEIPEDIINCIDKLQHDQDVIDNTADHSNAYFELKQELEEYIERMFMDKYDKSITPEKIKQIEKFIEKSKLLNEYLLFDYPITPEEFIQQDRKIKKKYLVDLILRSEYGHILAIADILDGIHKGKYTYSELVDSNGQTIVGNFGHGVDYYSRGKEWIFCEMIANYSEIVKSQYSKEGIELLRIYVGNELTNLLEKYYNEKILYSTKYTKQSTL